MKKRIFSDAWGEIIEIKRYRGKHGKFISDAYGRRLERQRAPYLRVDREQYLVTPSGKRGQRISIQTPQYVEKLTAPFRVEETNIYEALRETNILRQVHQAARAVITVRGRDKQGRMRRMRDEIIIGERNQDLQLAMAIESMLEDEGFGDKRFYQYLMRYVSPRGHLLREKPRLGLTDLQIGVQLYVK